MTDRKHHKTGVITLDIMNSKLMSGDISLEDYDRAIEFACAMYRDQFNVIGYIAMAFARCDLSEVEQACSLPVKTEDHDLNASALIDQANSQMGNDHLMAKDFQRQMRRMTLRAKRKQEEMREEVHGADSGNVEALIRRSLEAI
jgi:hypothetical protein